MKKTTEKMVTLALGSLLLAVVACAPQAQIVTNSQDEGIRQGDSAKVGDTIATSTVAVVGLVQDEDGHLYPGSICSGSLLPQNMVVTAAHCIPEGVRLYVVFSNSIFDGGKYQRVDGVVVHARYTKELSDQDGKVVRNRNDIALVHYTGTTPSTHQAAQVLSDLSALKEGADVTVAGFGIGDDTDMMKTPIGQKPNTSTAGVGTLRSAPVKIFTTDFSETELVLDQTAGRGACEGDSGGPAYIKQNGKLMLFGVASWGPVRGPNSGCLKYAIYTEVLGYVDFINKAASALLTRAQEGQ